MSFPIFNRSTGETINFNTKEERDLYVSDNDLSVYQGLLPELVVRKPKTLLEMGNKNFLETFGLSPKEAAGFIPVVGDVLDITDIGKDIYDKNYLSAGIGAGMLILPNFIEKPIKKAWKYIKRIPVRGVAHNNRVFKHSIRNPKQVGSTTYIVDRDKKIAEKQFELKYGQKGEYETIKALGIEEYPILSIETPLRQDVKNYYNDVMLPLFNNWAVKVDTPTSFRKYEVIPYYSKNRNWADMFPMTDKFEPGGFYMPNSKRAYIIGKNSNNPFIQGHEALSHATDDYLPYKITKKYEDMVNDLGNATDWRELRASLNEVRQNVYSLGRKIEDMSDAELLTMLSNTPYGNLYYIKEFNKLSKELKLSWILKYRNALLTLPVVTGIIINNNNEL